MANDSDLAICVILRGGLAVPASVLAWALASIEAALREVAEEELLALHSEEATPSHDAIDRAIARLKTTEPSGLLLQTATTGSIVLTGVVAGLSYWLLDKTIGETTAAAWQESSLHRKLLRVLRGRAADRPREVHDKVGRTLAERRPSKGPQPSVDVRLDSQPNGSPIVIVVITVDPLRDYAPPLPNPPLPSKGPPKRPSKGPRDSTPDYHHRPAPTPSKKVRTH